MKHIINFTSDSQRVTRNAVWITDLHIDAAQLHIGSEFDQTLIDAQPDMLLIGGDVSNGEGSLELINQYSTIIGKPVYFVLGNHDYYNGSIHKIRKLAEEISKKNELLHYLSTSRIIELNSTTALIGHDGWCDGREGDFLNSEINLNDYRFIEELSNITNEERLRRLNALGAEAANFIRSQLQAALKKYPHVLILTHTPPFKECCLYDNHVTDENWAPHFVCKAIGDVLLELAESHPKNKILVLCGHSHHKADVQKLPNLRILTGHSTLGLPTIQGIVTL